MHDNQTLSVTTFKLGPAWLGLPIIAVREILVATRVTPVHRLDSFVLGLINVRGQVVTVLDLAARLGLKRKHSVGEGGGQFIIIRTNQEIERLSVESAGVRTTDDPIAFYVDEIGDVSEIPKPVLCPPPPNVDEVDRAFLSHVARQEGRLLGILDIDKVLVQEAKA